MIETLIIGGGASGLCAAAELARVRGDGRGIVVLEKNDRTGKKLLSTGNGRCNLSNRDMDVSHFHGSVAAMVGRMLEEGAWRKVRDFWHDLGIDYVEDDRGRLYPRSLQASSVLNCLRRYLLKAGVEERTGCEVKNVRPKGAYFSVDTVQKEAETGRVQKKTLTARCVMVCVGGKASPKFGSDGFGQTLAASLGLKTEPMRPSICRLKLSDGVVKSLSGLRLVAPVSLMEDGRKEEGSVGEVLFTDEGISGPAVLDVSRMAGKLCEEGKKPYLALDLASEYTEEETEALLTRRFEALREYTVQDALEGWLHKKLIPVVISRAGIDRTQKAENVSKEQVQRLAGCLKAFTLTIRSTDGFREAQTTAGGLRAEEINDRFECQKYPLLYWCGEALDLDGDCGGYNLTFAALSGITAARDAAGKLAQNG